MRKIHIYGDASLYRKAKPLSEKDLNDPSLKELIREMKEIVMETKGVGLSANQIGDPRAVIVASMIQSPKEDDLEVYLNPEIIEEIGEQASLEGCLSLPGVQTRIKRPDEIKMKYLRQDGHEATLSTKGFPAAVLCHETDHILGRLITYHMNYAGRLKIKSLFKKLKRGKIRFKPKDKPPVSMEISP